MALKIVNPAWKDAVTKKAEKHAPTVLAWMEANPDNHYVTLDELRVALPAIAADLSRAVVNQIVVLIGATVEGAESADV